MVAAKIESNNSTIRIHDEFFDSTPEYRIQHLNRIVTDHYKRRYVSNEQDNRVPVVDAKQAVSFE